MASNGKFDEREGAKPETDKKSWMSSAQLWISNPNSQLQSVIRIHNSKSKIKPFFFMLCEPYDDHVLIDKRRRRSVCESEPISDM